MAKRMLFYLLCLFQVQLFADHFLTYIIPCYNCEKWIQEAIESIYRQKLSCAFEIVCTDDGSTDRTYDLLQKLREKHPEIYIIRHPKNRGGSAARNTCVQNSSGDLIFCLDSDNVLHPNTVHQLIEQMDASHSDIVAFGGMQYFEGHFKKTGFVAYKNQYLLSDVLENANTPPWSGNYLYTRQSYLAAGGYPENVSALDTFAFGFRQLCTGSKLTTVPGTFYWHRGGLNSYYIRESKAKKLQMDFIELMLSNREIFTLESIEALERNLLQAKLGKEFFSPSDFLDQKLLKVN